MYVCMYNEKNMFTHVWLYVLFSQGTFTAPDIIKPEAPSQHPKRHMKEAPSQHLTTTKQAWAPSQHPSQQNKPTYSTPIVMLAGPRLDLGCMRPLQIAHLSSTCFLFFLQAPQVYANTPEQVDGTFIRSYSVQVCTQKPSTYYKIAGYRHIYVYIYIYVCDNM